MIDVKKTITSSIKHYLMKLMKLGDNNLKVFKKIIYLIIGILVGGSLSVSGASYQTLFKNPMVSPDILGVSAGAGNPARPYACRRLGLLSFPLR